MSIEAYLSAIEAREKEARHKFLRTENQNDYLADCWRKDAHVMVKLVRKYREALDKMMGDEVSSVQSNPHKNPHWIAQEALGYDPREELQNPAGGSG